MDHRKVIAMCAEIAERAEVQGIHPHSLRHTFIELAKLNGFDYQALQAYVGHSNKDIIGTYLTRLQMLAGNELVKVEPVFREIIGEERLGKL